MLKWTLGHKLPTPGPLAQNQEPTEKPQENVHFARRRKNGGVVRKATVRALRRQQVENKENQPVGVVGVGNQAASSPKTPLQDISNSPIYFPTPTRRLRRRPSHPLRLSENFGSFESKNESPKNTVPSIRRNSTGDVVDSRRLASTLNTAPTMQIEYSPGPLIATQSLISLRRRLTKSISGGENEKPQPFLRESRGVGVTVASESSPSFESVLEEKSLFDQVGNKTGFLSTLRRQNSRIENTLMCSLSERLEWLRLNSQMNHIDSSGATNQGIDTTTINKAKSRRSDGDEDDGRASKRLKDCDSISVRMQRRSRGDVRTLRCDKPKPKTDPPRTMMGLTLPMGIPSPAASDDSGLCSIGLEGIQPLNISPIRPLTEAALSGLTGSADSPASSSLLVNKFSPFSSTSSFYTHKFSSTSLGSSLRKRLNDEELELNGSCEEMVPMIKTPRLGRPENSEYFDEWLTASPLAMVEKRSRSRRCLRFVSPGRTTRRRTSSLQTLSSSKLRDSKLNSVGEIELRAYLQYNMLTVQVGKASELHRPGGRTCNAYAKVALVPSSERTFFRTPVQRESSCPNFDEKFSFELQPEDLHKRILVSVWHRDRENRKSEFLGCVSLSVKNAVKKEVCGSFRLAAQSGASTSSNSGPCVRTGRGVSPASVMARRSECSSVEEVVTVDSEEAPQDDSSFLRHLELEGSEECNGRAGRTLFTTTKILSKAPNAGFGLSIAWTQPPRIERVEAGQAAERAGICPGDFVIFVGKTNVVTKPEEQVLQLIKSCGNELALEIYRKTSNGVMESAAHRTAAPLTCQVPRRAPAPAPAAYQSPRSGTACSGGTASTYDLTKRRLHLPHVAFSSESTASQMEDPLKKTVHQLLGKEQSFAVNLQFGVNRFLLPLAERRDFLNPTQHHTLFQNIEELLRLSEDIIEQAVQEDMDTPGSFVGRLYIKRINTLTTAYRRYCSGIKRADCLLVEQSKNTEFTRFCSEPPIPKRRPDLTTFLHKPLEHYRDLLKLTSTILDQSKSSEDDHYALTRVVHELHTSYREWTSGTGIMEPEVEGRLLLSVQDLESRLVFTRCKPFVLSAPGRQWIFGGDLSRVEGRAVRPFWALLFTDMMVFAKVSRDRVLFITEEPLSLISVSQAFFNIRKRANEFRLLLNTSGSGMDSPANAMCAPDLSLNRTPRKNAKNRSIALRAPTPELKAVWQNLIQRQIIYLNTARGGTPASSPLESPDPPTTLSVGTLDSLSLRRQAVPDSKICLPQRNYEHKEIDITKGSTKQLNELIDHKCRQLGKTKTSKGGAMHLAEWMKGQLGNCKEVPEADEKVIPEPEPEIWSQEELKRRTNQLQVSGFTGNRNESRCEEIDLASERSVSRNTEVSQQSFSTSESLTTVKSNHADKQVSVCRQCRDTCLKAEAYDDDDFDDNWGSLMMCGMGGDPFTPSSLPSISVLPATPDRDAHRRVEGSPSRCGSSLGHSSIPHSPIPTIHRPHSRISEIIEGDEDEDTPEGSLQSSELEQPYRTLSSSLRRFGTMASLDQVESTEQLSPDASEDEEDEEDEEADESPLRRIEIQDKIQTTSPSSSNPQETRRSQDYSSAMRCSKTYPEIIQPIRSWVAPAEMAQPVRGWTARAGSFVAEKMALFERLSTSDTTAVRKTSFLERYLKPSGDAHPDSPPEQGTNTSSSGRGEDEGETSGATSGEEVWGTPTSGGEVEEELIGESAALSFMDSPHGSSGGGDDDTEQLMEDLLISLPMLAARTPGIPPRRRLEPLLEEDDTESSSAPCSPKPLQEIAVEQGRVSSGYQTQQHHDNCPEFGQNSTLRPLGNRREAPPRPRIGTIDRALGIESDDEDGLEDDTPGKGKAPASPSFLHRLGLRKNREEGRKSSKFGALIQDRLQRIPNPKNVHKTGFSTLKIHLEALPSPRSLIPSIPTLKNGSTYPIAKAQLQKLANRVIRKGKVERQLTNLSHIEVIKRGNDTFASNIPARIRKRVMGKLSDLKNPEGPLRPMRRSDAFRRRTSSPTYSYGKFSFELLLGFLSNKKDQESPNRNSAAYGGKPLFKYLFNRDTLDDIPTTLPETCQPAREDGKQMERRFWKQLSRRRSNPPSVQPSRSPQVAI